MSAWTYYKSKSSLFNGNKSQRTLSRMMVATPFAALALSCAPAVLAIGVSAVAIGAMGKLATKSAE